MRTACVIALCLVAALVAAAQPPAAAAAAWARPVEGSVIRAFELGPDRFAAGQHRGVDLAARPGGEVRAACAGRVSFAGRVPGGGLTVSVRCGRFIATHQRLGATAVRPGVAVRAAARLGVAGHPHLERGHPPHVHLGVREAASGTYVDPMTLLGGPPPRRPPVLAPVRRPHASPRRPAPTTAPSRAPRVTPVGLPARVRPAWASQPHVTPPVPWTVWAGLACVGLGLPIGGFVRLRRRRRIAAPAIQSA